MRSKRFGFLSILAFGAILGMAGYIVAAILNDFVSRIPVIKNINPPVRDTMMWAVATYSWMFVVSYNTREWKKDLLGNEMSQRDGYWFAYISTTTVGLGDIYLEPEVFRNTDLVTFPVLFLTGFTLFSAFIGKLVEAVSSGMGSNKKKTLLDALEREMKRTRSAANDVAKKEEKSPAPVASDEDGNET